MESSNAKAASTTPHYQPKIMRPYISPMREQNRQPLQMRRVSLLKSSGKSKERISSHEERLHKIFSSSSLEPLSLTESDVNRALSSEKGCWSEQTTEDHVVDDVKMIEVAAAVKPAKTIADVMIENRVVVYVEVRAENNDRSDGIKTVIYELGAQVNDRLNRKTTHVVFKDGLQSTYDKAKKLNIPVVSVLWLEACKTQLRLADPKDFTIFNAHRYDFPEQYPKLKRFRGMQPLGENARRRSSVLSSAITPKNSMVTPIGLKTQVKTSTRKPLLTSTEKKTPSFGHEVKPNPSRSLFNEKEETISVNNSTIIMEPESVPLVSLEQTPRSMRNQRRLTMYAMSSNPTAKEKPVEMRNPKISVNTSVELPKSRKRPGTPLLNTVLTKRAMHTPQNKQTPAIINNKPTNNRRRTLFTPNKLIEYCGNKSNIKNNNHLFFDTSSCGGLIETTPPNGSKSSRTNSTDTLITSFTGMFKASPATPPFKDSIASPPTPPFKGSIVTATVSAFVTPAPSSNRRKTIYDEYSASFSSTRTPQSRHSIIEISKDILSQRIQNLNRITEAKLTRDKRAVDSDSIFPPPDNFEEFMKLYSTPKNVLLLDQTPNSEKATTTTSEGVKKRKLFTTPHTMQTPSGVHILGMCPRSSVNDSDCFNLIDDQVPMKQRSEVNLEPEMKLTMHKNSKLVRHDDAILERPMPAKRRRLKTEKINLEFITPVRPRRRSTMLLLN